MKLMTELSILSAEKSSHSLAVRVLGKLSQWVSLPLRIIAPSSKIIKRFVYLTAAQIKLPTLHGSVQIDGFITVIGTANIQIGSQSRISRDVELGTEGAGSIDIGHAVRINRGTTLFAYENISIGDHTLIGEFVSIRDANHGIAPDQLVRSQEHHSRPISIGRDVWIGRGSVILPGVTIGDGSIIGANSVVTKNIEPGMIAVGTPAVAVRPR